MRGLNKGMGEGVRGKKGKTKQDRVRCANAVGFITISSKNWM